MLNYIWAAMIGLSFLCAALTGRMEELSAAAVSGAQRAVELVFSMTGMLCLWTGLMKIAEAGGLTEVLARLFAPLLRRLFPKYAQDPPVQEAISMNLAANLLGLGNAATPLGLAAMKEMASRSGNPGTADDGMVMFVVINTASIQLIPATTGALRASFGAARPFDILPAVWVASVVSLAAGIAAAYLLGRRKHG